MKWTLLAAAALVLCCGLPFRTHETRTLLPVQTVQAERTEAGVRIVTEAGEGSGATWDDAVAALRMAAPGEVYFDTAGQVVLCGKTDRLVNELLESGILRPAAQVRRSGGLTDPEGLCEVLVRELGANAQTLERQSRAGRPAAGGAGHGPARLGGKPCGIDSSAP